MAEKFRATMHNGRLRASGEAYCVKHNDRQFDVSKADNITPNPERKNLYFVMDENGVVDSHPSISFEEHEKALYKRLFGESLAKQNERHVAGGHSERVHTMDEYRTAPRTCPEETILQLGTMESHADTAAFIKSVNLWCSRINEKFGKNLILSTGAIHFDEATPHAHIRMIWCGDGKDGLEVSQTKALAELGIERPDTSKAKSKFNNPKQTFTELTRQMWLDAAKECGVEVIEEPDILGKRGLVKEEYISQKLREENAKLSAERDFLASEAQSLRQETNRLREAINALKRVFQPLQRLANKLSKLLCVDGRDALSHCTDELKEIEKIEHEESL